MIFICVKWKIKPEHADQWPEIARDFTEKTRAEEGNLFFEWSRSVEDPNQYVLIEACSRGPYLELFGRGVRKGWTVWGNQAHNAWRPDWDTYAYNSGNVAAE